MNWFARLFPPTIRQSRPPKPVDDVQAGLKWVWMGEDGWREVCSFCGGNCGQCGITGRVGNVPASLNEIIKNGGWDKNTPAGLPRGGR